MNQQFEWENRMKWIEEQIILLKSIEEEFKEEIENTKFKANPLNILNFKSDDEIIEKQQEVTKAEDNKKLIKIQRPKLKVEVKEKENLKDPKFHDKSKNDGIKFSEEIQSDHDKLTNQLIETVKLIKRNNISLQQVVKNDDKIIEEASNLLTFNSEKLNLQGKTLKNYSRKSWATTWFLIFLMFFMLFIFLFMYIFIRFTK